MKRGGGSDGAADAALLRRATAGDAEAFGRLVEAHQPRVYRLALTLVHDEVAAEEVAQDAFVRLHRSLTEFRGDSSLATWLHRVTVNLCRDWQRARQRDERFVDLDDASPGLRLVSDSAQERLELEERVLRIREALGRVSPEQREAISLRYLSEMSYAEIADVVGVSANTVASRVYRGLARLGEVLTGTSDEQEVS